MNNSTLVRCCAPLALAVALLVSGCSSVFVSAPVGEKTLKLDPNEWAGTWLTLDGKAIIVTVPSGTQGELQLTGIELNNAEAQLKRYTIHVSESAGWLFASVKPEEGEDPRRFLWGRLKREDDHVVIWAPDARGFGALVREGKLKGRVLESGDVALEPMPVETLAAFASGALGVPFDWDSPFILRRVGR